MYLPVHDRNLQSQRGLVIKTCLPVQVDRQAQGNLGRPEIRDRNIGMFQCIISHSVIHARHDILHKNTTDGTRFARRGIVRRQQIVIVAAILFENIIPSLVQIRQVWIWRQSGEQVEGFTLPDQALFI